MKSGSHCSRSLMRSCRSLEPIVDSLLGCEKNWTPRTCAIHAALNNLPGVAVRTLAVAPGRGVGRCAISAPHVTRLDKARFERFGGVSSINATER
jgi:hypothetical protein